MPRTVGPPGAPSSSAALITAAAVRRLLNCECADANGGGHEFPALSTYGWYLEQEGLYPYQGLYRVFCASGTSRLAACLSSGSPANMAAFSTHCSALAGRVARPGKAGRRALSVRAAAGNGARVDGFSKNDIMCAWCPGSRPGCSAFHQVCGRERCCSAHEEC